MIFLIYFALLLGLTNCSFNPPTGKGFSYIVNQSDDSIASTNQMLQLKHPNKPKKTCYKILNWIYWQMKLLKTKRLWLLHAQLRDHPMWQSLGLLTMKKFKIKLTNWMLSQKWDMSKELIAWRVDASSGYVANTLGLVDHYQLDVFFTPKKS